MNAIELLKADHDLVDGLFEEIEGSDASEHPKLFQRIKAASAESAYA